MYQLKKSWKSSKRHNKPAQTSLMLLQMNLFNKSDRIDDVIKNDLCIELRLDAEVSTISVAILFSNGKTETVSLCVCVCVCVMFVSVLNNSFSLRQWELKVVKTFWISPSFCHSRYKPDVQTGFSSDVI